jgi:uncharacterized protein (TIGR02217 family)
MSFLEIRLPEAVRPSMAGGPVFSTEIIEINSGHEHRNIGADEPRREYEIEYVRSIDDLRALHAFFLVVRGAAYGFRAKDWIDYEVISTEGLLGTGAGSGYPTYQSKKRYTFGAQSFDRTIAKLVSGTHTQYRNGSPVTVGDSAGNVTVDNDTGIVTFAADDTEAITGHTVGSSHQFTTAADLTGLGIGEKVYLSGITGTAATLLNGIAHTISNKSGAGPYTWTISTNTGGSPTLTASGGNSYAYPQAGDILSWAGEFDVPARFTSDKFTARLLRVGGACEITGLQLKEVRV